MAAGRSGARTAQPRCPGRDAGYDQAGPWTCSLGWAARCSSTRGSGAAPLVVSAARHRHPDRRQGLGCSPASAGSAALSRLPSEPRALRGHQGGRGSRCPRHHPVHTRHAQHQEARLPCRRPDLGGKPFQKGTGKPKTQHDSSALTQTTGQQARVSDWTSEGERGPLPGNERQGSSHRGAAPPESPRYPGKLRFAFQGQLCEHQLSLCPVTCVASAPSRPSPSASLQGGAQRRIPEYTTSVCQ